MCSHLSIQNIILESDSQLVVNELECVARSLSFLGNIFFDIQPLMANFQHYEIVFFYRRCNRVAHSLARFVWNVEKIILWYGDVPKFLLQTTWFDKKSCSIAGKFMKWLSLFSIQKKN